MSHKKIQDYLPINTDEKVDDIIALLQNGRLQVNANDIETQVVLQINKLKLQRYFKEEFVKYKEIILRIYRQNQTAVKSSRMDSNHKKEAKKKEVSSSSNQWKRNLTSELCACKNKNIHELALLIDQSENLLKRIIKKSRPDLSDIADEEIIDDRTINLISEFLYSSLNAKKRKHKESPNSGLVGMKKYNNKFKPSYGKSGNYSKLIYIRTKS